MKNRHFPIAALLAASLAAAITARAQEGPVKYDAIEDVVYGNKDGLALTLDVLTPKANAKGLGIILVSSGSWRSGKSDIAAENTARREREHWTQGLLKGGYTLFVARHGSTPRYLVSDMTEDIRRSVRYVRLNAERFHVAPDALGITSGSSGGHLALMAGLRGADGRPDAADPVERTSSRVQAIVAWFPPTDLVNWGGERGYHTIEQSRPGLLPSILGKITDIESQLKEISPVYHVDKDDPPLLLIHGDQDRTVPLQQSEVLKARYEEAGLPVQLVVHPGGGHSYWPGIMSDYAAVWAWFERYLTAR